MEPPDRVRAQRLQPIQPRPILLQVKAKEDDDDTYPIAIGLRRNRRNGWFARKQVGDPQPMLFPV